MRSFGPNATFWPTLADVYSAQALWWYLRNQLYFDLGLDERADCYLLSYDRMVADPPNEMARLCQFLGVDRDHRSTSPIARRHAPREPLPIDRRIRALGADLDPVEGIAAIRARLT